ncbi:IS21-like element helper ATPase IstB [Streptomyces sp.]|uniref:IS21-like element helper ATPase IstB n=1 Tax=Streptomyces sp. TaxID=1931 RepID=UPI002CF6B04D|nr:IS21-like element helper ATPase IstB [Streptomyces sp.]HLL35582.1 IS21-like element helper ATPase IstB [Streptomyces sp.]HZF92711.1 IS21-like element helper ATPase IstB [Streptomyces sp.]
MTRTPPPPTATLGYALFATRWLQAPLYFGLVVVQGVYVYKFFNELWTLVVRCVSGRADETYVMLAVLKLVDVVMIANLLIMVIVGGYETFVSRIGLQGHRDQPEWLSHVNPNVLKVKLATAIVGISSVHLLQMFVDVHHTERHDLLWGTVIHMAFIVSAAILAYMSGPMLARSEHPPKEHPHPGAATDPDPVAGEPATAPTVPLPIPAQAGPPVREPHAEDRIRDAAFPARKQLEDFDTGYPRVFDRDAVARLGKLDFVAARRNVVFTGAPGTGKTHLAIGLGLRACQAGHRVLFATAAEWADRLAAAEAAGRLAEELTGLDDVPLLIVDEVGYVPFGADAARLLFRLVAHRYERGSLIVTSDRPLERWHEVFDGPSVPAMVDRLAHHAETVRLEGDSYRKRPATSAWAERSY